jgi:glucosylceramidase
MISARPQTDLHFRGNALLRSIFLLFLLAAVSCCVICSGVKPVPPPVTQGPAVQPVLTTGDQAMLLQPQPTVSFGSGGGGGPLVITVDDSVTYQQMDGVGASLTDSSAWLLWNKLDALQQAALMQNLFSPSAGIGMSFLRQPMGASDFSASGNYSYDDMPNGQTDPNLLSFSISHDTAYIIPLVKQALAVNPSLKVVALPWSPPAWMKTTGTMNGGSIITSDFPSLAQYFVKFVQAYQQQGIPIYAVSVQNEPLYSTSNYPSESLPAGDEADFLANHLGPALSSAGLGGVKIFAYEHNWDNPAYPESVLGSPASGYVAGTSFHCYGGDVAAQSQVQAAYPTKDIWFTECTGTVGSNFGGDLAWNAEHLLIGATRNWARSVLLWNIALDQNSGPKNGGCSNCRGVVTINDATTPSSITYNVEYYVLGHLGKFVVPGAHRIASNTFGPGSIEDVAFKNPDGSKVLLALNASGASSSFTVSWNGENFNYNLPAGALATFTWK